MGVHTVDARVAQECGGPRGVTGQQRLSAPSASSAGSPVGSSERDAVGSEAVVADA